MIKLHEKDLFWKCYCRYYRNSLRSTPPPKTICNLFWKAVGGMLLFLIWDVPAWLILPLFGLVSGGLIYCSIGTASTLLVALTFFCSAISLVLSGMRLINFINNLDSYLVSELVLKTLLGIFVISFYVLVSFVCSLFWIEFQPSHWLLLGFLTPGVIFATVVSALYLMHYLFFAKNRTAEIVRTYLYALKNRVCPVVLAPWEWYNTEDK